MEKCGFKYHHTEEGKTSPLGDIRTEHFYLLTREDWKNGKRNIKMSHDKNYDKNHYTADWNLSGILSLHFTTIHGEVT